jgi:hypothetical protein
MTTNRSSIWLTGALGLALASAAAAPALAHHSFAMFDRSKQVTLEGTVHDFQWTNPHSWIDLEVVNDKGGTDLYGVELNSPNNLARQGWKSTSLKTGDKVSLTINPLRDGRKGGLFVAVKLPNGQMLGDPTRKVPNPQTAPEKSGASPT